MFGSPPAEDRDRGFRRIGSGREKWILPGKTLKEFVPGAVTQRERVLLKLFRGERFGFCGRYLLMDGPAQEAVLALVGRFGGCGAVFGKPKGKPVCVGIS